MDKIKAAEERYPLTDNLAVTKRSAFVMGWDAAISTQSPKWVKAKDRLPGDGGNPPPSPCKRRLMG